MNIFWGEFLVQIVNVLKDSLARISSYKLERMS